MWYFTQPIAHRGFHQGHEIPENSKAAFQKCIDLKFPIELDVIYHEKLNELFVFHDETLNRVCGVDKHFQDVTQDEITNLRLFQSNEKIPTLKDTLEQVDGKVPLLIEVKAINFNDNYGVALRKVLEGYKGKMAIQSFNPRVLTWMKKNFNTVKRGLLICEFEELKFSLKKIVLKNMLLFPSCSPHFLAVEKNALSLKSIRALRSLVNIPVLCWTIKSKKEFQSYQKNIDNIIFEEFNPNE